MVMIENFQTDKRPVVVGISAELSVDLVQTLYLFIF